MNRQLVILISMGEREQENKPKPFFRLGQIVGTPGALDALLEAK